MVRWPAAGVETAAVLYTGPDCVITGPASLRHQGVRTPATDLIDVLIPASAKRENVSFVRVHRTARMPDQAHNLNGIRWALAARAVADTVPRGEFDLREVRELVAGAVQCGSCTIEQLADELRSGPTRESRRLRAVLYEVIDGIASAAEGDLRLLVKRAGLPEPMYNPDLYVGSQFLGRRRPVVAGENAGVARGTRLEGVAPGAWAVGKDNGAAQPNDRARNLRPA